MRRTARGAGLFLASILTAAAGAPATAEEGVARVSVGYGRNQPLPRLVAPGEWLPHGCYLAVPYRGGSTLRFERKEARGYTLRIDGGPEQPAWINVQKTDDLAVLKRELARGSRGFAVLASPEMLASLPALPAGATSPWPSSATFRTSPGSRSSAGWRPWRCTSRNSRTWGRWPSSATSRRCV